ncbi:MAG: hypothetical protein HRU80_08095 [Ignavibacteriales bacterium]|nr:MAG: hypothetical protein HRU80_08095 [Ignavibacteriales bacterium]
MQKKLQILIPVWLFILLYIYPQGTGNYTPGVTYKGSNGYVEYIAGNLPIILSAPHGGDMKPSLIPDRTWGTTVNDFNTQELTRYLASEIFLKTGKYPHVIINRLARIKLDANRDSLEAAQENPLALRAWYEYHAFIDTAKAIASGNYGAGLLIDMHGHGHELQAIELGYLLSSSDLSRTDIQLNSVTYRNKSSIRSLATVSPLTFSELLRGPTSLGTLFVNNGFLAIPSATLTAPGSNPYFDGGYITERHGSKSGGTIDAIQLEFYRNGLRDTDQNARNFAKKLEQIIKTYMQIHYPGITGTREYAGIPEGYILHQNYPNPFNPATTIRFTVPESGSPFVQIRIYNQLGEAVAMLYEGELAGGTHEFNFTPAAETAGGVLFCRIITGSFSTVQKMMYLK